MTQARNLSRLLNKDITTYMYTATAGQTVFTGSDTNSQTLTFDNQSIMVTYNGVMLEKGSEFTVALNTVTLLAGAEVNAEVNVIVFNNVSLGGYVKSTGGDIDGSITATGITSTGKLNIPSHSSDPTSGHSAGDIYFNTTNNVAKIYNGTNWNQLSNKFTATGGTVTAHGIYKVHTFTSSGTFTPVSGGVVDVLIVAGGGGYAGDGGGGGGAGGMIVLTDTFITGAPHTITIGNGGASCGANSCSATSGSNTTAFGFTAIGGGSGSRVTAGSGGSGMGQGRSATTSAGAGTAGQGNAGGNKGDNVSGGGGGAGSVGGNASGTTSGAGGAGLQNSFRTGSNEWYSVGGRGGIHTTGTIIAHTTGYGGPGSGGGSRSTVVDDDLGDAGENGIVVIRYLA